MHRTFRLRRRLIQVRPLHGKKLKVRTHGDQLTIIIRRGRRYAGGT
jgi:hypothetical protein